MYEEIIGPWYREWRLYVDFDDLQTDDFFALCEQTYCMEKYPEKV